MNRQTPEFDQRIADWLEVDPTKAPPDVMATVRAALPSIPQARRGLFAPGRFPLMPALSRATAVAAVALVAVVGAGGLIYLNAANSGGAGSQKTPAPTPAPTPNTPGITGWKTYSSAVYGYTISYPEDWSVVARATARWQPGAAEEGPWRDIFFNNAPEGARDTSMVFEAAQFPAPAEVDLSSWDGLLTAFGETCVYLDTCTSGPVVQASTRLCMGSAGCRPVAVVHDNDLPRAVFGDPETGQVTYIRIGRVDDFPGAARYGGTVMLLKSILSQMGVREPQPGEVAQ